MTRKYAYFFPRWCIYIPVLILPIPFWLIANFYLSGPSIYKTFGLNAVAIIGTIIYIISKTAITVSEKDIVFISGFTSGPIEWKSITFKKITKFNCERIKISGTKWGQVYWVNNYLYPNLIESLREKCPKNHPCYAVLSEIN